MMDLAWDEAFGGKVDPYIRVMFDAWLFRSENLAMKTKEWVDLVSAGIDREAQTANGVIKRAKDLKFLEAVQVEGDKRQRLLTVAAETQLKYEHVLKLKRDILKVIAVQLGDPENLTAGKGLVPDSIYTNVERE